MTEIRFRGIVSEGDAYRVEPYEQHGSILIGGLDFVMNVEHVFNNHYKNSKPVGIKIIDGDPEQVFGQMALDEGWGYSDFTPIDPDTLTIGGNDILGALKRRVGQEVIVVVSDEPTYFIVDAEPNRKEIE